MAIYRDLGALYARNAGADLSAKLHFLAHVDTDGDIVLAGDGEHVLGVIVEGAVANAPVTVQFGGIAKCVLGGTVASGARVASDAAGETVAAAVTEYEFGTCLVGGVDGDVVPVALLPGRAAA